MTATHRTNDIHTLEARLALRLVCDLNAQAETLPRDTKERLRFAREQALSRAQRRRAATADAALGLSRSGAALVLGSFVPWLRRAASVLPLLLLLGGLAAIQQWSTREQVRATAEIDALLLADALPPSAYGDPGFAEFLRSDPQP